MYADIEIGKNVICRNCIRTHERLDERLSKPISIWHVGDRFHFDRYKVLFVGKLARRSPGKQTRFGYLDSRQRGEELFFDSSWAYWSYTREIVSQLYGSPEKGWDRIAFTNLVKCNNSDSVDRATTEMKSNCINRLGVFWRELQILKPRKVIFYTHRGYDDYIEPYRTESSFRDISSRTHERRNGGKNILWWHRQFREGNRVVLEFLRTSHPERQDKAGFVNKLTRWIRRNKY